MNPLRELRIGLTTTALRATVRGLALAGDPVATVLGRTTVDDPYPLYERIRARGDVSRHPLGLYLVPAHALARDLLRDPRLRVTPKVEHVGVDWNTERGDAERLVHPTEESLLALNPPEHTRLRRLVSPWFTPAALRGHTPRIEAIVDHILDTLDGRPDFDLRTEFAGVVPLAVVEYLFDLPPGADRAQLHRWGSVLVGTLDGIRSLGERHAVRRTLVEMTARFEDLLARRAGRGGTDVLSRLADADASPRDAVALAGLLLIGGFETTVNLIGSGALRLLKQPGLRTAIEEADSTAAFVEETLRLDSPIQFTLRMTAAPVPLASRELPAGVPVVLLLAAANRDPRVFADPHRFDPCRFNARDHLAFSSGVHYCLGAGLARLVSAVALRRLFERHPDLASAGPPRVERIRNVRGWTSIPVRTTAGVPGQRLSQGTSKRS